MELELKHIAPWMYKELSDYTDVEQWKAYPDNENYKISNYGRVLSISRYVNHNSGGKALKKARIMTQTDNGSGYLSVGLTFNSKTKSLRVSRLVASTWLDNPKNKPQVNHKNGDKYDNRVCNLEWNTSGENVMHAWNNGLSKKRSTYLELQEKVNKILPYTCYDVEVKTPHGEGRVLLGQSRLVIQYHDDKRENLIKAIRFWGDDFKIKLRSLSDLTKEIEHNGEKFVPALVLWSVNIEEEKLFKLYGDIPFYWTTCLELDRKHLDWGTIQKLLEWHFDIYGLIDNNLAIPKT